MVYNITKDGMAIYTCVVTSCIAVFTKVFTVYMYLCTSAIEC